MWSSGGGSPILLCYHRNTPEIFNVWFFWRLLLLRVFVYTCIYKPKGKSNKTQITGPIPYIRMIEAHCVQWEYSECGLLLDCQTKSLINVNAQNSQAFTSVQILFIFSLIFCVLLRIFFLDVFFWLEFERIAMMLRLIIKM